MNKTNPKTSAWIFAKVAITVACLYFAIRKIDFPAFHDEFRHLKWPWLGLAMGQFLLIPLLGGQRWRIVLSSLGGAMRAAAGIRLFWIGMAFNQVLPSISGGDAIRIVWAWRDGVSLSLAAHSVILERIAMMLTLIILVVVMQYGVADHFSTPGSPLLYLLILLGALLALGALSIADKVLEILPDWRVCKAVALLSSDARRAFFTVSSFKLVVLCFVTHINTAIGCLWLGHSLGLPINLADCVFYISLVTLISTLPLSIGGWGIRESAIVVLFGRLGIAAHGALAFSVLFGLSVAVISLMGVVGVWKSSRAWGIEHLFPKAPQHAEAAAQKSAQC
jgi:glycosyltransferase 2 family protein